MRPIRIRLRCQPSYAHHSFIQIQKTTLLALLVSQIANQWAPHKFKTISKAKIWFAFSIMLVYVYDDSYVWKRKACAGKWRWARFILPTQSVEALYQGIRLPSQNRIFIVYMDGCCRDRIQTAHSTRNVARVHIRFWQCTTTTEKYPFDRIRMGMQAYKKIIDIYSREWDWERVGFEWEICECES